MDSTTWAIWHDPLGYDALRDGPPYLPSEVRGKVASGANPTTFGADVRDLFEACLAEYGDAPMAELSVLLSAVRAEAMIHQAHHWQSRGQTFYGDHLLFERVYNDVTGFVDSLAERAVGSGGDILVQPLMQASHQIAFTKLFYSDAPIRPEPEEMPVLSLRALLKSAYLLTLVYGSLESKNALSNGTDNLLQDIADRQEQLVYLLKQRTRTREAHVMTAKTALESFEQTLRVRRVAGRFMEAMEFNTPEAMKEYLKDHPNADPKKHSVKKKDEGGAKSKGEANVRGVHVTDKAEV